MKKMCLRNDFVVETKGRCFLCLNQIKRACKRKPTHSVYTLQCLSNYLKMDLTKVFVGKEDISTHLWAKVENSRLKAELCEDCAPLTDQFSELYRQLEMIEMRILDSLNLLYGKLAKTVEEEDDDEKFKEWEADLGGKFQIVEALRADAIQKCLSKLKAFPPRIKVRKLDKKTFMEKLIKEKNFTSAIDPEGQRCQVNTKQEPDPSPNATSDEGLDNDWNISDGNSSESEVEKTQGIEEHKSLTSQADFEVDAPTPVEEIRPIKIHAKSGNPFGKSNRFSINRQTGSYKCGMCPREFEKYGSFHHHYRSSHLKVSYKCPAPGCGKTFKSTTSFRKHFQVEHRGVRFSCDNCGKVFKEHRTLLTHQKKAHAEAGLKCKFCSQTFTFVAEMNLHIKRHCRFKPNNALTTNNAKSYLAVVSPLAKDSSNPIECYICHRRFGSRRERAIHYKNHPCPHCGKRFKQITSVRYHVEAVHLGIRHKCGNPGCDMDYPDRSNLRKHKQICKFQAMAKDKMIMKTSTLAGGNNITSTIAKLEKTIPVRRDGEEQEDLNDNLRL